MRRANQFHYGRDSLNGFQLFKQVTINLKMKEKSLFDIIFNVLLQFCCNIFIIHYITWEYLAFLRIVIQWITEHICFA